MQMTKLKVIPMPKEVAGADEDGNFGSIFVKAAIFTDNTDFTDGVNEMCIRDRGRYTQPACCFKLQ